MGRMLAGRRKVAFGHNLVPCLEDAG